MYEYLLAWPRCNSIESPKICLASRRACRNTQCHLVLPVSELSYRMPRTILILRNFFPTRRNPASFDLHSLRMETLRPRSDKRIKRSHRPFGTYLIAMGRSHRSRMPQPSIILQTYHPYAMSDCSSIVIEMTHGACQTPTPWRPSVAYGAANPETT